jgi:3-methylcrotonyl-CoA carboxylase alpha subunit
VAARLAADDAFDAPLAGFRLNAPARRSVALAHAGTVRLVDIEEARACSVSLGVDDIDFHAPEEGGAPTLTGYRDNEEVVVFAEGTAHRFALDARGTGHHHAHDGDILAPMPGKVIAVDVAQGQTVTAGQRLLVLEAMKMEHALTAPFDGTVSGLAVSAGSQVQVEAVLCTVEAAPTE